MHPSKSNNVIILPQMIGRYYHSKLKLNWNFRVRQCHFHFLNLLDPTHYSAPVFFDDLLADQGSPIDMNLQVHPNIFLKFLNFHAKTYEKEMKKKKTEKMYFKNRRIKELGKVLYFNDFIENFPSL